MQVTCPKCNSRFAVADYLLNPTGRKLKCAVCGVVWYALPGSSRKELSKVLGEIHLENERQQCTCQPDITSIRRHDSEVNSKADASSSTVSACAEHAIGKGSIPSEELSKNPNATIGATDFILSEQIPRGEPISVGATMWYCSSTDSKKGSEEKSRNGTQLESDGFPKTVSTACSATGSRTDSFAGNNRFAHNARDRSNDITHTCFDNVNLNKLIINNGLGLISSLFVRNSNNSVNCKQKRSYRAFASLLAIGVMLAVSTGSAWYGRTQIFELWLALRNTIADLGRTVTTDVAESLKFSHITTLVMVEEGVQVLIVEGMIENISPISVLLPPLRLICRDENRQIIRKSEIMNPPVSTLQPGKKTKFVLRLHNPPIGATIDIGLNQI